MKKSCFNSVLITLLLVMLCGGLQQALAQAVSPNDFAFGMAVDTVGGQPVQTLVVPKIVYERSTLPGLQDARVFNNEGAAVPHAFHRSTQQPEQTETRVDLSIFPLYGRLQDALNTLDVQVRKDQSGTLIRVGEQPANIPAPLRAYLIDASQLDEPIHEMVFYWPTAPQNLLVRVSIESSEDLISWSSVGRPQTLASLDHQQQVLLRNKITVSPRKARYYRVSWPASATFPVLSRLEGISKSLGEEHERYWISQALSAEEEGVFITEINPAIPFDRVVIDLAESQRIVRVRLTSRAEKDDIETLQFQGLAYHLAAGEDDWRSPAISVNTRSHRYWSLTILDDQALLLGEAPTLRLGWEPDRLLFVPQGQGPYTFAYGNPKAEAVAFTSNELFLPIQHQFDDVYQIPQATAGDSIELGGPALLETGPELPWQKLLLWGSLLAGIALLGFMAIRLMSNTHSE